MHATSVFRRAPLLPWHTKHGAKLVECEGWSIPLSYSPIATFQPNPIPPGLASGVGIVDLTCCRKDNLIGDGVCELAAQLPGEGRANQVGSVVELDSESVGLACRLRSDQMLLLSTKPNLSGAAVASNPFSLVDDLHTSHRICRQDVTSTFAFFGLTGSRVNDVLRRLIPMDVASEALPIGNCVQTVMASVHVVLIRWRRAVESVTGVCVAWDLAEYLWQEIFDAGSDLGIQSVGLEAWSGVLKIGSGHEI